MFSLLAACRSWRRCLKSKIVPSKLLDKQLSATSDKEPNLASEEFASCIRLCRCIPLLLLPAWTKAVIPRPRPVVGRSKIISESTVSGGGSKISFRRLCVRFKMLVGTFCPRKVEAARSAVDRSGARAILTGTTRRRLRSAGFPRFHAWNWSRMRWS